MYFITGDKHGDFRHIERFCRTDTSKDDVMIILGDAGINYYQNTRDRSLKQRLENLPITLFCIHGNHEIRPQNISTYHEKLRNGGRVLVEDEYPSLLFAIDGEIYDLGGRQCIVIGGAYSVDKFYRLERGWGWWQDEQPSEAIKQYVEKQLADTGNKIDVVLSHTCPRRYEPTEVFLSFIDQSSVDKSTEAWLDTIEERIFYDKWCCGHYHTQKTVDRVQFLFESIIRF